MTVPKHWQIVELREVAFVQTGFAKGKVISGESVRLPYLRVANVQDGFLDLSEIKEVEVAPYEIERFRLQIGDVLLTEGGDFDKLGRGTLWRGEITNCLHQNHIFAVRTSQEFLEPLFFSYQTASPYGRKYFLECSKQSTNLASINSTQLKEFPVLLPPLAEQRAIAAILSTWDEAITLTKRLIAALRQRKQALMQILLTGEVRFPGFEEEWEKVRIGSFLRESRISGSDGATAKKITVRLYGKGVYPKDEARIGSENTRYYARRAGQLIYSKLDFLNGAFGIIPKNMDGYESTLDLPAFDTASTIDARYILSFISREEFYKTFWRQAKGGRKARRVAPEELLGTSIEMPNFSRSRIVHHE